jgi:SpoVK/Ycf46/Vps4 family AAA+-type ATPase
MNKNTLDQLIAAFNASPSKQLASIICLSLAEQNHPQLLTEFITTLSDKLSNDDLIDCAQDLYNQDEHEEVIQILDKNQDSHLNLIVKALYQQGDGDKARELYLEKTANSPELVNNETEQFIQLSSTQQNPKKSKLKVVEKIDIAEITNLANYQQKTTNFDDVVGLETIKKQINKKIIMPFQKPGLFQRFKKKIGGGVLLYGPPGCGKTLLARATAGECNASFYNVQISDILDMYIGESEQKLHAIFEKARAQTPSVLFFDEFEAMAGKREGNRNTSYNNITSQFLTELDGFAQNNSGVLVLASTNVPWSIDSAFLRPGRFDRMFFVPPPDVIARQGILEHYMQDRPSSNDINFAAIATKCKGYSGADLYNLIEMVADEAIEETIATNKDVLINSEHFKQVLTFSNSTTIEWLTTARNYARYANDGGRYDDVLKFINKHGK